MENGPAVDLVMLICSWVGIVVFYLIVNAHKTDGKMKMSSVLQCCTREGKKFHPKKALRQENGQGPSGLPEENMVQEGIRCV